ncbi:hypothetical protein GCM10010394_47370 [Streptomyces crystallinus]|uniref:Uncharacterized protein n=1 Tax=Streptomyces crystallinus TaxID=68191 RepID=A0ABP3RQ46_9ACTN
MLWIDTVWLIVSSSLETPVYENDKSLDAGPYSPTASDGSPHPAASTPTTATAPPATAALRLIPDIPRMFRPLVMTYWLQPEHRSPAAGKGLPDTRPSGL